MKRFLVELFLIWTIPIAISIVLALIASILPALIWHWEYYWILVLGGAFAAAFWWTCIIAGVVYFITLEGRKEERN